MPHYRKLLVRCVPLLLSQAGCDFTPGTMTEGSSSDSSDSAESSSTGSASGETTTAPAETDEGSSEASSSAATSSSTGLDTIPPSAVDDVYVVLMNGETLEVAPADGVLVNDADADGGVLAVVADAGVVSEAGALVELHADGSFSYTPATDVWGEDGFAYELVDGQGGSAQGHVRVLVRPTAIPLSRVDDGFGGFAIEGTEIYGQSGWDVDGLGDVDGDGLGDVVIGARGVELQGPQTGRCYVVFGKADTEAVVLSDIAAGEGGFAIDGEAAWDLACDAVRGAGDVDGDGFADIVIGAQIHGAHEMDAPGRAYVVFGKSDGDPVELSSVGEGIGGFAIDAAFDNVLTGIAVDGGGDVNGDGLADLLVGTDPSQLGGSPPGSYVVFGKAGGDAVSLADVGQGIGGFAIHGELASDYAGMHLAMAGDVDGDTLADLLIGAAGADPNGNDSGRSYLVFGKAETDAVLLSQVATGIGGFAIDGSAPDTYFGRVLAGAGDVNGDGLADLLLGAAPAAGAGGEGSGRSYVVFGKPDGELVALTDVVAGVGGFALDGANLDDYSGISVAGVGDLDGDGLDDVLVGAWLADPHGSASGRSYLVYGKSDGDMVMLGQVATGVGGFALDGPTAYGFAGHAVAGAGDVDGDGIVDLLIGADGIDANDTLDAGRSYVVFGRDLITPR